MKKQKRSTKNSSSLAQAKGSITGIQCKISAPETYVPKASDFLSNKRGGYKPPPIPNSSNRAHRNGLSPVPIVPRSTLPGVPPTKTPNLRSVIIGGNEIILTEYDRFHLPFKGYSDPRPGETEFQISASLP